MVIRVFPEDYVAFQVEDDETWYAGWMERDDNGIASEFHVITRVDGAPVRFESREEAERDCGYHAVAMMYPESHWLGDENGE